MKTARTFTIDQELVERLQEEKNQSTTVNELLKEYYSITGTEEDEIKRSIKEADENIKKATKDKELLIKRIEKIDIQKEKLREKYKSIPEDVINDFKKFKKMDAETLKVRYDSIYQYKYSSLVYSELLKAWRSWYG